MAFFPARPPFLFLHIATGWDFRALLDHRDRMAREYNLDLVVHSNAEANCAPWCCAPTSSRRRGQPPASLTW